MHSPLKCTQVAVGFRAASCKCSRLPTIAHANGINRDKSLSLCPAKANAVGFAMQRVQFRISQNGGKEIPCRLHRPNKNVARKCHCVVGSYYANGSSEQCRGNGTSREIFAILVFTLSLTLKILNCFANGCALTVKFQSEECTLARV